MHWEDKYFSRLWTCFEIATFMATRSENSNVEEAMRSVNVLSLPIATVAIALQFAFWACMILVQVLWNNVSNNCLFLALFAMYQIPVWFFMSYVAVRYSRARLKLTRQMVAFDVTEAACREESDRTMILDAIEDRFGSTEAFNRFL
eukprot:TRINITY_DN12702_c0_g1_i2.p1 TRINITY_DN12702_c0_g1~~TRINITY_DN12702_c0_g1_i2.p1  ORF type:complete len:146 (-),score=16.58 TRINITY_DN12702_c0_g1_i2:551-988(-)